MRVLDDRFDGRDWRNFVSVQILDDDRNAAVRRIRRFGGQA
jgi:hypothetical protein